MSEWEWNYGNELQEQYPDIDRYGLLLAPGHQTAIGVNKVDN